MDAASLAWIVQHRPRALLCPGRFTSKEKKIINSLAPWRHCRSTWWEQDAIRRGIHGFRHSCRVALHTLILGLCHRDITPPELSALMYAGLLHDCRRRNDNADVLHGPRMAALIAQQPEILPQRIRPWKDAVSDAIAFHSEVYRTIHPQKQYARSRAFIDILKTADALDRYRFPRSDWWLDLRHLVLIPERRLLAVAFELLVATEKEFLQHHRDRIAVQKGLAHVFNVVE